MLVTDPHGAEGVDILVVGYLRVGNLHGAEGVDIVVVDHLRVGN